MKVYALREMVTKYGYMPVRGYHTSVESAKKHAKESLEKTSEWDVALYEVPSTIQLINWIDLLNADCISSDLEGRTPRDFLVFTKVVFESAALKRYRKKEKAK